MKKMYRWIRILTALLLCITILPQKVMAEEEHVDTFTWYNPLYYSGEQAESLNSGTNAASIDPSVITEIRSQLKARNTNFTVNVPGSELPDVKALMEEAMSHTGDPIEGDYLKWQYGSWRSSTSYSRYSDGTITNIRVTFTVAYYTDASQEKEVDTAVSALLSELALDGASDYEKVKAVYNWMADNISYAMDYQTNPQDINHTAYGAIIRRVCVCQGYAVLFYRLMCSLGVDCRVISGIGNGGRHAWNIVKLGNLYYNLDVTWASTARNKPEYFLRGTKYFSDHTADAEYETDEFHAAYPLSEEDYDPSTQGEPIEVSQVIVEPEYSYVTRGDSIQLKASVLPEDAEDQSIIWSSSDKTIAAVDQNGMVTALSSGIAIITASSTNGYKDTCMIIVVVPVTSVTLNKNHLSLHIGEQETLAAEVLPEDASDRSVTWESSDPSVASVDENGTVTAHAYGTADITATSSDEQFSDTCTVEVINRSAESVSLNKQAITLKKGEQETLIATVLPQDADDKTVTWTSSNATVASVDSNGKITAHQSGTAVITVKTNDGGYTAECTVTVITPVTGVSLNKNNLTLPEGGTETLTAAISPEDADDQTVTWTSSDAAIAAVDNNGKVTAIKSGTAVITVQTNDGSYTAKCSVTVTKKEEPVYVSSVTLNKKELTLKAGKSETLTATVLPENAEDKSVTWTSSDAAIASVDSNGKVTAQKSGTAVITVKTNDGGYTAECKVTVITPVTGVSLNKNTLALLEGETETLTATVTPENADDKSVTWSSSDASVAKVDNGKVTAIKAGTTVIKVTTKDGGYTAECKVTVTKKEETVHVSGVSLNKEELTLRVGKSETLTAAVLPEDAEDKSVTWSSSDPSVAKVDANGKVTAVADTGIADPASAVITVTTNDGKYTASCTVTVEDPINAFVRRLYRLCFNRTADPGGFRQWTTGLRTKKNTAAATVQFFFTSQEFKNLKLNDGDFVEMCYQVMMDRASDAGGKKNWVNTLDIGMSQTYVLRGFIASREFAKICADYGITVGSINLTEPRDQNQGITALVSRCYNEVLGRKAEVKGLNSWCSHVLNASNRKETAIVMASNGFFHSVEYLNKHTSNDQYVRTLYRTFLGREADQGGYNNWMNALNSGTTRDTVMRGFAYSKEFADIMAKYGIR
ncbi:MAG: Ig-like domain-containing protein [Solobacterium sp.]|nr:Ig-like domain-containing protein [Solobacterium sp.]